VSCRYLIRGLLAAAALVAASAAEAQILLSGQPVPLASLQPEPTGAEPSLAAIRLGAGRAAGDVGSPSQAAIQAPFDDLIDTHAGLNSLRPALVRAVVMAESAFDPSARSPKGALGLMQLMPETARQFGVANPFDPEDNIRAGTAYLRQLLDRYGNDEALALAAYNAGPGAVDRHGQSVPPYRETQHYVARVSAMAGEAPRASHAAIFKRTEQIDGREVVTYTNRRTH